MSLKSLQKCFYSLTAALVWILMCDSVYADSSKIQNPGNGHYYQRFDTVMTWKSAKTFCESKGGYLATLTAKEENDFVYNNLASDSPNKNIWLGATDEVEEGVWKWVTGESWNYTNWLTTQPSNTCGNEHYLTFCWLQNNTWNDLCNDVVNNCSACADPYNYTSLSAICEWDGASTDSCKDSDNDGVSDLWDKCPDTPAGSYVDKNGCPATGLYTQAQLDTAKQAAIQSCKDNPVSCGLFSQTQIDASKQDGINIVKANPADYQLVTQAQSDQAVRAEQLKWDANEDGRIGLEDIIRMLQVLAGLRP